MTEMKPELVEFLRHLSTSTEARFAGTTSVLIDQTVLSELVQRATAPETPVHVRVAIDKRVHSYQEHVVALSAQVRHLQQCRGTPDAAVHAARAARGSLTAFLKAMRPDNDALNRSSIED